MSTTGENVPTNSVESGTDTGGPDDAKDDGTAADREAEALPLDVVFDILRNERRRRVLTYLDGRDGEADLSDLAEHVAAIENDTTVEELSTQQRKRVYVGLYQSHLPKMAEAAIIEFDKDRGVISSGPTLDQLESYLDVNAAETGTGPWPVVLGGAAVAGYVLPTVGGTIGSVAGGVAVAAALAGYGVSNWRR